MHGVQEEKGIGATTDPQANQSKGGGPFLNAEVMAADLPGFLPRWLGPVSVSTGVGTEA